MFLQLFNPLTEKLSFYIAGYALNRGCTYYNLILRPFFLIRELFYLIGEK